jgi:hypothetical protein
MATKRPTLSDRSFLAAIFRPSKNPVPAGLRKRHIVKTPGRRAARVRSFNKFTPAQQAIIDRTGNRESYLRGETTLAEARRQLREKAVAQEIVKPIRVRVRETPTIDNVAANIIRITNTSPKNTTVNTKTVYRNVRRMTETQKRRAAALRNYHEIIVAMPEFDDLEERINRLWYK